MKCRHTIVLLNLLQSILLLTYYPINSIFLGQSLFEYKRSFAPLGSCADYHDRIRICRRCLINLYYNYAIHSLNVCRSVATIINRKQVRRNGLQSKRVHAALGLGDEPHQLLGWSDTGIC